MVETAGVLSFGFEADFSGFTRAADSAGQTLDRLAGRAGAWAEATAVTTLTMSALPDAWAVIWVSAAREEETTSFMAFFTISPKFGPWSEMELTAVGGAPPWTLA